MVQCVYQWHLRCCDDAYDGSITDDMDIAEAVKEGMDGRRDGSDKDDNFENDADDKDIHIVADSNIVDENEGDLTNTIIKIVEVVAIMIAGSGKGDDR